jgi:autotransporter-associated beta strand protein
MKPTATLQRFLLLSSTLLATPFIQATPYYWDIDGATAGAGGATPSGAWITGSTTWSTSPNGTEATPAVTTSLLDDLYFSAGVNATGAYTVTLNDSQNAGSLTFQDGTATISGTGGVINLGGTGIINVTNSLLVVPNTTVIGAGTDTIISGSTGLTKAGVGTLTLSSTAVNTFTGGLNVNGGTLALDFSNLATPTDLINNGNSLALGGGNLSITGNAAGTTSQTLGNLTVTSGGGSLLANPNGGPATNISLGSLTTTASGSGFVVGRAVGSGTGTLAITTTNNKDATGIYGGRVVFADGTANTGYDWATTSDLTSPFALSGYAGYTALDTTSVGVVTDTNNSRITAGAVLPAASSRTTNSLKFENPAAASTFDIVAGNTLSLTSGGLLVTGANNNINITNGSITAGDGTKPADLVVHQFNPAQQLGIGITGANLNNTPEITSSIVDNGSQPVTLVKTGPGSIRFLGTNTFTGGIIVNQGSVDFGLNALNNNPMVFNANSFFYTNGAHITSGAITLNNGSQVTICNNNSSFTVNADVTGSGGLSVANGGQGAITLNLNGTGNTFTGPVRFTANNGTQQATINVASFVDTDALGTGNITFGAGTASSISHNFTLAAAAATPLTLNNRYFEMGGLQVNQQINNNSSQALTITGGVVVSGSRGKNLQFGGTGAGISTFAGAIANHPNPTDPGTIPNAVRKTGGGNTLTLASVEGIEVGATITGSVLTAGTTITAVNRLTREITLSSSFPSGNNANFNVGVIFTIPGVINSVSVNKAGASTWVLSGDNSYTGTTAIDGGTLIINGNQSAATGPVGVNGTSTLGGSGTIGGSVTVAAGAKIAPGTSVGTLAIAGGLDISAMAGGAGTLNYELGPIAASDKITVGGDLNIGSDTLGFSDFVFSNVGGLQAGTYTLITSNALSGTLNGADLAGTIGAFDATLQISGNNIVLALVAGKPTTTLVINLGAGTQIPGGAFGTFGALNLPIPPLPVGSILRSIEVNTVLAATDNGNFASDLAVLFDPTPVTPGGDFSVVMTNGVIKFGAPVELGWPAAANFGPPTPLVDTKAAANWVAAGTIDLASTGIFLGNAYNNNINAPAEGGTWSGTITLTYDLVSTGSDYDTWASTNAPTGSPADDFDGDGVANAVEFVLGGTKNTNDLGKLPTATTSGGNLTFSFVRDQDSIGGSTTTAIDVGADLATWPATYTVGADTAGSTNGVTVTKDIPTAGLDTVTLSVPQGLDPKKFARLKVVIAP